MKRFEFAFTVSQIRYLFYHCLIVNSRVVLLAWYWMKWGVRSGPSRM